MQVGVSGGLLLVLWSHSRGLFTSITGGGDGCGQDVHQVEGLIRRMLGHMYMAVYMAYGLWPLHSSVIASVPSSAQLVFLMPLARNRSSEDMRILRACGSGGSMVIQVIQAIWYKSVAATGP